VTQDRPFPPLANFAGFDHCLENQERGRRVMMGRSGLAVLAVALWVGAAVPEGLAEDRHAGYYYPLPTSEEVYEARARMLDEASRSLRIRFVTGVTQQLQTRPFPPTAAMFAKGAEAEKLIIVALEDGRIDTIYRARALFANLTAVSRTTPIFQDYGVEEFFTFFDFAKMLGFAQITITNGRDFAHQVTLK